jgi:cytochrome c oxidase assembly protein subunit 15
MKGQSMAEKRKLFEEVQTDSRPQVQAGVIDAVSRGAPGAIRIWLLILFALVAVMIVVGGLTRLTDSGLSITEWNLVSGTIPPLSQSDWDAAFALYQQSPEYQIQNKGMTMEAFRQIFWWEWGHRQLGRFIGLFWAAGFLLFCVRKQIPNGWTGNLFAIGILIGFQGLIGWLMVYSGLNEAAVQAERTDVASYWLAAHLGGAFVIFGLITWFVLKLGRDPVELLQARRSGNPKLFSMSTGLMHFAFLQIILGALVAGIDAGRAFPTWPLMGDNFLPPFPFDLTPWYVNFYENAGLVQFIHRMSGYLLFIFAIVVWNRGRKSAYGVTRATYHAVMAMMVLQMLLGIMTVLYSAQLHVAITHQIGAVALWVLVIRARFNAAYPVAQSVRSQ